MAEVRDPRQGGFRFFLREATALSHRKLEVAIALEEHCETRETYCSMLAGMAGLYAPLEDALRLLDWQSVGIDLDKRIKLPWLNADLGSLGLLPEAVATLPQATALPMISNLADGFGVLYVLEGSTLGGQVILPLLQRQLGVSPHLGGRFFASYGAETSANWRSYVSALEKFAKASRIADRITGAALATFESFIQWFANGAGRPKTAEGQHHVG